MFRDLLLTIERTLKKPRRFRLSLRALLAFLTITCLVLGKLSLDARRQRRAVEWVEQNGGTVTYEWQIRSGERGPLKPPAPIWLMKLAGPHYFDTVKEVRFFHTNVNSLARLAELPDLELIQAMKSDVTDLSPLATLLQLRSLTLSESKIEDLSPLVDLENLVFLNISSNRVRDISPIASLTSLKNLNIGMNPISDLSPLRSLKNLTYLGLFETPVADYAVLKDIPSLQGLSFRSKMMGEDELAKLRASTNVLDVLRPYLASD